MIAVIPILKSVVQKAREIINKSNKNKLDVPQSGSLGERFIGELARLHPCRFVFSIDAHVLKKIVLLIGHNIL
jgi:hypothetical protein